jgi:hypothetical protein
VQRMCLSSYTRCPAARASTCTSPRPTARSSARWQASWWAPSVDERPEGDPLISVNGQRTTRRHAWCSGSRSLSSHVEWPVRGYDAKDPKWPTADAYRSLCAHRSEGHLSGAVESNSSKRSCRGVGGLVGDVGRPSQGHPRPKVRPDRVLTTATRQDSIRVAVV